MEIEEVPLRGHQSQWDIRQLRDLLCDLERRLGYGPSLGRSDTCRFTPPWREGRAEPLPLHWDVDPHDRDVLWYQGILALTDAPTGAGGFRCAPSVMVNRDRWPTSWTTAGWGEEYRPVGVADDEVVEIPLGVGDLLVFDSHLPHGTVRNTASSPRVAFALQMFPEGSPAEADANIADHLAGIAPPWWRWKPGHDRVEPAPPAMLTDHGWRLLGRPTESPTQTEQRRGHGPPPSPRELREPLSPSGGRCEDHRPVVSPSSARRPRLQADVLAPDLGVGRDEVSPQHDADGVVDEHDPAAVLGHPGVAAFEVPRLTDHRGADTELAQESAAVPAR